MISDKQHSTTVSFQLFTRFMIHAYISMTTVDYYTLLFLTVTYTNIYIEISIFIFPDLFVSGVVLWK